MRLASILAVLTRLLNWLLRVSERRRDAEIENEVRDAVAKDATILDLRRAEGIHQRVADVRRADRLRPGGSDPPDKKRFRD